MQKEMVKYWLDLAQYDIETADAMFATGRWLYVGFMCHQVLEKTLKAYWCSTQETPPPYIHNLKRLCDGVGLTEKLSDDQIEFVARMMPLNIEARYPEYKDALLRTLSRDVCEGIIANTKEMALWIKNMCLASSEDIETN